MFLGDWVEFGAVVTKQQTTSGSQPATRQLRRTRRGVVIGVGVVYRSEAGSPPTLCERRTVLLVAVSLHRVYRVFPADAAATNAPRSRRRRSATTTATQPGGSVTDEIGKRDLEVLVANEINRRMAINSEFTAYDITQALRRNDPTVTIAHTNVRRMVHAQMDAIVSGGLYDRETAYFGSEAAVRYVPL
jgi:hypothetical protein